MTVLIVCSSRGGSTIFAEILRRHRGLRHLPGEVNPLLRRAGLSGASALDDALTAEDAATPAAARFCEDLLARAGGYPAPDLGVRAGGPRAWRAFAQDAAEAIGWQWPEFLGAGAVEELADRLYRALVAGADDPADGLAEADRLVLPVDAAEPGALEALTWRALRIARGRWSGIDPRLYDLGGDVGGGSGELGMDGGLSDWAGLAGLPPVPDLPQLPLTEEPPFLLLSPWERRASGPLVLKTPADAFRLDFYRALVAAGRLPGPLRLLHLRRNPASAINGLMDGWRYHGFHARCLAPGSLSIAGYSERCAGGDRWWKFDLPPGWAGWRGAALAEVCAMQWASAHRAILDWRARNPEVEVLEVRFEDVLRDLPGEIARVLAWIGGEGADARFVEGLRAPLPRMATERPRQRRWFARSAEILPLLERPEGRLRGLGLRGLIEELGYDRPGYAAPDGWI